MSKDGFEVSLLKDSEFDAWIDISKKGTLYHDLSWKNIIKEAYNLKPYYQVIKENSEIIGIIPGFMVRKNQLISLPYLPFAGIVMKTGINDSYEEKIASALKDKFRSITLKSIEKKNTIKNFTGYVTMVKDLESSEEESFKNLSCKQKNMIRKAYSFSYSLKPVTVQEFYEIYLKATNALGTPAHSKKFFSLIEREFEKSLSINNLFLEDTPIGTIFEIDYRDTRYDLWAFSIKEFLKKKPNIFLYWERVKDAIGNGLKYYDFGRSEMDGNTYKFKKKWGAYPIQLFYRRYLLNNDRLECADLPVAKGGKASEMWKKLPSFMANFIGPRLRKHVY